MTNTIRLTEINGKVIIPVGTLGSKMDLFEASDPQLTGTSPLKAFQHIVDEVLKNEGISADVGYEIELENKEIVSLEEFMIVVDDEHEKLSAQYNEMVSAINTAFWKPYT